jgi:hypothetical protein
MYIENVTNFSPFVITDVSSATISPQLPFNKTISLKEGDYIREYNCSADCNPPCTIQWKYKLSTDNFQEAMSNGATLLRQRVYKDKALFRCVVSQNSHKVLHENIKLFIKCKIFFYFSLRLIVMENYVVHIVI